MFGSSLASASVGPVPSLPWIDRRMRYAHRRDDDGDLRSRLREIALERCRFDYRRLGTMLACEGIVMNHKKLLRLYSLMVSPTDIAVKATPIAMATAVLRENGRCCR
jgi:hypothetical protein